MTRGKKILISLAALLILGLLGYWIRDALLPEEARIRAMVEEIGDAFNRGEAGSVAAHLAEDFTEEETRGGRDEVRIFLFQFFQEERDRQGNLRYRVEVQPEEMEIAVEETEPKAAELSVKARFFTRTSKQAEIAPFGTIRFTARLSKATGGWLILRARHKMVEGKWPF